MQTRQFLLLKAVLGLCAWALVAVAVWPSFGELGERIAAGGVESLALPTLLTAAAVVAFEVAVLAFALHSAVRFLHSRSAGRDA